jgi:hypothetical protein
VVTTTSGVVVVVFTIYLFAAKHRHPLPSERGFSKLPTGRHLSGETKSATAEDEHSRIHEYPMLDSSYDQLWKCTLHSLPADCNTMCRLWFHHPAEKDEFPMAALLTKAGRPERNG